MENNLRLDDLQINNLKIWQNPDLFCFGTDAVLLANFARPKSKDILLDIGTGNCIIPILISAKSDIKRMTALEIQKECADLSQKNVDFNNLNEIIKVVHGDINDEKLFTPASFSYITCNPPYKPMGAGLKNPSSPLAIARHEVLCTLDDIIRRSSSLLMSKGKLCMVHKPERTSEIFHLMKKYRIEPKRIMTVHSHDGEPPCLVLIEGAKDGGVGIKWEPPLTIYDNEGNYTANVNKLYQNSKENKQ